MSVGYDKGGYLTNFTIGFTNFTMFDIHGHWFKTEIPVSKLCCSLTFFNTKKTTI